MRYLSSISLALIVLMALACTATPAELTPAFTEDEVTELIRDWEVKAVDEPILSDSDHRNFDRGKAVALSDRACLKDVKSYFVGKTPEGNLEYAITKNPDVDIEHSFKFNGIWLVKVTSVWKENERHGEGEIKRTCLYRLDDRTGEVNPGGKD